MRSLLVPLAESSLILAGLLLYGLQLVSFPIIPLFFVAWGSLHIRRMGWRDVGFRRPDKWLPIVAIAPVAAIGYQVLDVFVIVPILQRLTGQAIVLSQAMAMRANLLAFTVSLGAAWTIGAFIEEMFFRGYLLSRVVDFAAGRRAGTWIAVVASALIFGAAHGYQGITGMVDNALTGLVLGMLYIIARRNLWLPILTHGAIDTVGLLMIFTGLYP